MRYRRVTYWIVSAILFLLNCQAQTGDWQAVQDIPPGSLISVKTQFGSKRCAFQIAGDTELYCDVVTFHRQSIRRVRLEHPNASAVLGAVVGTGIGIGVGVAVTNNSRDAETRVYDPAAYGILGGIVLGMIMHRIPVVHGKVVYQR